MSDPEAPAADAKPAKPIVPIALTVVALIAGLGIGMKVVGPKVKGPSPADSAVADEAAAGEGHGEAAEGAEPKLVNINSVIANPSGTMGSRYVIMSVTFEVKDTPSQDKLTRAETPIRDAIIAVLEKETVESLGAQGAREALKVTMLEIAHRFAPGVKIAVYIPQFLIQ